MIASRRAVLLALVAAAALRLAFGLGYWVGKPLTHDEHEYLELGSNLAAGRGFAYDARGDGAERFGRAPLYPLFVAGLAILVPRADLPAAVRAAQALVGTATVLLLAVMARRLAGRRAAAAAAWTAAVYPPLVWVSAFVWSETLYMLMAWGNAVVLAPALDAPSRQRGSGNLRMLAGGVLAGAAALTRPAHLFFLLLVGACLVARRQLRWAAIVALGALLAIVPWTVRNYAAYDRIVLIASEGGVTFWTGNHPLAIGDGDMAANPAIKRDNLRLRAEHPGLSPEALEPVYYREAFGFIGSHPIAWLALEARKLFFLVVPAGPSYTLHSALYLTATWLSYGLLLPLGAAGVGLQWRRGTRPVTLLLLMGSTVLVCLVFLTQERFRLPVIDPALVVGAACFVARRAAGGPLTEDAAS